jgi:homogentisate 1,2-dioxygenase
MSEFMGMIHGAHYSRSSGFEPGGALLHNCWVPHGPDVATYDKAYNAALAPQKLDNHLAFMFETRYPMHLTPFALQAKELQKDIHQQWVGFPNHFSTQGKK